MFLAWLGRNLSPNGGRGSLAFLYHGKKDVGGGGGIIGLLHEWVRRDGLGPLHHKRGEVET
jgi:hypothetical protein